MFEEAVDSKEGGGMEENGGEQAGDGEHSASCENLHVAARFFWFLCWLEQAANTRGEIVIVGNESGKERREAGRGAHARDANQSFGEKERAMGVASDGAIVGGPFGETRPGAFERCEAADKWEGVGDEEKQEALEIVTRGMVGAFVA